MKKSAEIQQKSRGKLVMDWEAPGLLELEFGQRRFLVDANNLKPFRELKPEELAP
jgi:hypothetical protein